MAIVCIEGGDAAGKATQTEILAERLGATLFSFPDYSTTCGEAILSNLKSEWFAANANENADGTWSQEADKNALVLQSLMLTNRLERSADLRAAARRGHVVLDRFDASSYVYGKIDGLDPAWLRRANEQLPVRPDLYVLIDVPVDEGFRRRPERRDRYESDRSRLERVREEYLRLFAEGQEARARQVEEHWKDPALPALLPRWVVVDGVGTVDEVAARVWAVCVQAGA